MTDTAFRATNASGRAISLLNETAPIVTVPSPPSSDLSDESNPTSTDRPRRKYHCSESGCTKSFTTSGHLARHNRIHTGEKNFPCLFPGCQSRFSRQDNMMQHYRTHMSPKSSKRMPKSNNSEVRPRPRLHAHQRIRSDPYHVERPLTIDQHLNNYYRTSYTAHHPLLASKYNMPTPLGAVAAASHMQKLPQLSSSPSSPNILPLSPPLMSPPPSSSPPPQEEEKPDLFYQHKPLSFQNDSNPSLPFTLLHPPKLKQNSLYQLAHFVSTFG